MNTEEILVYVGTYTRTDSEGVYVFRMNYATGALSFVQAAPRVENPSFLAIAPDGGHLYAVSALGEEAGGASAFAIDAETGMLSLLNQQQTASAPPSYISVDGSGRYVLTANYARGLVSMLPIQEDGSLGAYSDQAKHEGSSVNERRQERAHAHCVVPSPDNRYAFVCDLGMDKIVAYKLDLENGEIPLNDVPYTETTPGAGPRHLTFHPNGRLVFVINELASTLTSYRYDADTGTLEHIQTVPGLPEDFEGSNTAADIHVSPSGKFLYGSMRGHDSIVVYAIDEETGELDYVEHKPSGGETPRNFAIDPTGTFLLAAHQDTNNIVVFRVEPDSGRLVETNNQVKVPMPVCIKMLPIS